MDIRVIKGSELTPVELETLVRDLCAIRDKVFTQRMKEEYADGETFFRGQILDPETVMICSFNAEGRATAYLAAVPQQAIYAELKEHDPELEDDPQNERFYVENIGSIADNLASAKIKIKMIKELILETDRRGKSMITMHVRIVNGLAGFVTRAFPIEVVRTIPMWYYTDEPAQYLVGHLDRERWFWKRKE